MATYDYDDLDAMYDDTLDDVYGDVSIAGMTYSTSYALKEIDPIAYRVGKSDWLDAEISSGSLYELEDGTYTDEEPTDDDEDED